MINKTTGYLLTALVITASVFAACGNKDSKDNELTKFKLPKDVAEKKLNAAQQFGYTTVDTANKIAQLRGHYLAAKELYGQGNVLGARVHAEHPVEELYESFRKAVVKRDPSLDREIEEKLKGAIALIDKHASKTAFNRYVDDISGPLMNRTLKATAPKVNPANELLLATSAANIINEAGDDYAASIGSADSKTVTLRTEYEDSYAFTLYCKLTINKLSNVQPSEKKSLIKKIGQFQASTYPQGIKPPEKVTVSVDTATNSATAIAKQLEVALDQELISAELEPLAEIRQVANLLDQSVQYYKDDDPVAAYKTISSAYIKHFEDLEAPLEVKDPKLKDDIEDRLGIKIPNLLKKKADVSLIETQVKAIKQDLKRAEKLLSTLEKESETEEE